MGGGGAGERLGKDTGIIMWGSPACWRPQLPPSPGSQTLGQKQRRDPWSRVARPPCFPQKTPCCSHAAAGPRRCGPDVGDELGPPLGPAPGSARAGAEAKRRGGGEPRGVRGHEATGGVGARSGADALLEALSEQRGGSLSATDRGRREGTRLRVRVTRKVKQCGKGEVIREGGVKRQRGRGQDPERPPPRAGRGRVGQRCRDDHAIRSREPALGPASPPGPPAPPQTPGGQDATSPGLSHPTCLHLSARDPNGWPAVERTGGACLISKRPSPSGVEAPGLPTGPGPSLPPRH